jgi:hypothetical protein
VLLISIITNKENLSRGKSKKKQAAKASGQGKPPVENCLELRVKQFYTLVISV